MLSLHVILAIALIGRPSVRPEWHTAVGTGWASHALSSTLSHPHVAPPRVGIV